MVELKCPRCGVEVIENAPTCWECSAEMRPKTEASSAQMGWIDVAKEIPPKRVEVLGALRGCDSGKYVMRPVEFVGADDHDWESGGYEIANCWGVTHWQPMPDPPK